MNSDQLAAANATVTPNFFAHRRRFRQTMFAVVRIERRTKLISHPYGCARGNQLGNHCPITLTVAQLKKSFYVEVRLCKTRHIEGEERVFEGNRA